MRLERLILSNVLSSEDLSRKILPYLKADYFRDRVDGILYGLIAAYVDRYKKLPTREALRIDLQNASGIGNDDEVKRAAEAIDEVTEEPPATDVQWLLDTAEQFCKDSAIYTAIRDSMQILDDGDKKRPRSAIPKLLEDALAVSFDTHIGHDFIEDSPERFAFYHKRARKIPFDIEYLNKATDGGVEGKTLNVVSAATGGGKTLAMCHFAAHNLLDGKNVLYITMEMREEKIGERIDANLLNMTIGDLHLLTEDAYLKKIGRVREKALGKLVIKEYPTVGAGAGHFRHLISELRAKKGFHPDVVYIDYLNLCLSMRYRYGDANSYNYNKSVAEELRGLAVEENVAMWTATQLNRAGFVDSDPNLQHVSDSFGIPMTADFMIIMVGSEDLDGLGQVMIKQTNKNRYADPTKNRSFVVGMDRDRMRLYNVEVTAQASATVSQMKNELAADSPWEGVFDKKMFEGFK